MDIYQQNILDYYKHPRHRGELTGATYQSGVTNPSCGDSVQVFLQVENNRVIEARWTGEGCVLSQASADMLAEHVVGKLTSELGAIGSEVVVKLLGIEPSPNRLKCALLPLEALQQAATRH